METAFNTPFGHFENLLMSFGLTNAKKFPEYHCSFHSKFKAILIGKTPRMGRNLKLTPDSGRQPSAFMLC